MKSQKSKTKNLLSKELKYRILFLFAASFFFILIVAEIINSLSKNNSSSSGIMYLIILMAFSVAMAFSLKLKNYVYEKRFALLIELLLIVFGISLAFYLSDSSQKESLNETTKVKKYIMCMESNENMRIGKKIYNAYSKPNPSNFYLEKLHDSGVKVVLEDQNLINVLDPAQIALIRHYVSNIDVVNSLNEYYGNLYIKNPDYFNNPNGLKNQKELLEKVAYFLGVCREFQTQFGFRLNKADQDKAKLFDNNIKKYQDKVLKLKFLNDSFKF